MLKIGVTGGIGCGKTTVSDRFAHRGIPVIDADAITHRICEPGMPGYDAVVELFGEEILGAGRSIDRSRLGSMVFADQNQRAKLESRLHPLIFAEMRAQTLKCSGPYCILSIPLLFESGATELVDRILVVDCPAEEQQRRVLLRAGMDLAKFRGIIGAQVPREYRLRYADDVIVNDGDLISLDNQVEKLHNFYLETELR